jgi:hypothetical protein
MSIAKQNQRFSGYFRPKLRKTVTKRRIAENSDFGGILGRHRNDPDYWEPAPTEATNSGSVTLNCFRRSTNCQQLR